MIRFQASPAIPATTTPPCRAALVGRPAACMTSRRDIAALERLSREAGKAHPARVARVCADLEAERDLAEADAARMQAEGDATGAMTASQIAAGITRIRDLLARADNLVPQMITQQEDDQ